MIAACLGIGAVLLNWLPQWVASVWSLFSSEPIFQWLGEHHMLRLPFSPIYITGPVSIVLLVIILWGLFTPTRKRKALPESSSKPAPAHESPQSIPSVQPTIPVADLSYLADPAYDRFWPESWRRKKFLAAGEKIKTGVPRLRALQEVEADELASSQEVIRLCEELDTHGFGHPFEDAPYHFPKHLWLEVLKEAKNRHIDLGDVEDTQKHLGGLMTYLQGQSAAQPSKRFQVRCGTDVYSDNILVGSVPARYLQAEISLKSGTVHGCRAYLREITGQTRHWEGHEQLTFQLSESPDTLSKAIFENIKYRLDVLLLISTGVLSYATTIACGRVSRT
jgi:hypothetical protein